MNVLNLDKQELLLRPATWEDRGFMLIWRNEPAVRLNSENSDVISQSDHERWLESSLQNPSRVLLIGEQKRFGSATAVGVLRYDFSTRLEFTENQPTAANPDLIPNLPDIATVSVYLNSDVAGQGLGTQLLRLGTNWLKEYHPDIDEIQAKIKSDNHPSIRAFEKAGYQLVKASELKAKHLNQPQLLTYVLGLTAH